MKKFKSKLILILMITMSAVLYVSCGDFEDNASGSASTFTLQGAGS